MINGTWNGTLLEAWTPSVGAIAIETIGAQPFAQALQWSCRDIVSQTSLPVIAGTQVNVTAWLNAANLVGHPTDTDPWTVGIGMMFTDTMGVESWVAIATIASGTGWTLVTGQITVPPLAVQTRPWRNDLYGWTETSPGNAVNIGEQTAAATFTVLDGLWTTAKTDGCTVVAFTVAPRTDISTAANAQRLLLNDMIRKSMDYDILVDLDQSLTNVIPYGDGVHWDAPTHTKAARAIAASLVSGGSPGPTQGQPISQTPADNIACAVGQMWIDSSYLYACTASGTVKRVALGSF